MADIHDGTTRAPINRQAALIARKAKPIEQSPVADRWHPNPDELKARIGAALEHRQTTNPNTGKSYTGTVRGRMTALFYSHCEKVKSGNGGNRHFWLARCVCGEYELRKERTLRKPTADDRCHQCSKIEAGKYLQKQFTKTKKK